MSGTITLAVELFLIIDMRMLVDFLRTHGYRSYAVGRDGIVPEIRIGILIVCGVVVFLMSFFIMMSDMFSYIKEISDAVEEISDGNLYLTIEEKGNDEFEKLAGNINKMTREVLVIMDRERETERSKNELITSVAHDLRTPLTSITGYLELLRRNQQLDEETREKYIEIVYNKSKRLENLIYDLFDFTKLNHGKIAIKLGTINIVKLIEQLLDEFYPSFQENNLEYEFETEQKDFFIEADGDLLARLFDNLISNAIKYGSDGKLIKVHVKERADMVKIEVINYGKVIPSNELDNVFKKFYRVEQSRSENTGGTGLGLAIAKNVVEMHNGTIEVTSSLKGTSFAVCLPFHLNGHESSRFALSQESPSDFL
ncbi:sensor histidine kinase [Konateibacter massiliensis]|uniref:sensor histidine kinase n=1 Tax=Konateibacter massiliensis TaxID=2002841 RepID=UPI001F2F57E6|nr:HAMP domain-containing sensor histidine kinase [Konateibacter massiliensis]